MKIIVLGGTGFIGRHICEKLLRAGHEVTVPTRKLENARHVQMLPRLQPVACSVHDPAALAALVQGHDALINLVAILHGSEAEFDKVHVQLPRSIVAACRAAGVRRLVHISSLAAAPDAPSHYLRSKGRGEQVFLESGLPVSILRPSVVFGEGDRLLNVFASLQRLFPLVPLAGATAQFQPVWVEDVAQAAVQLVQAKDSQYDSKQFSSGEGSGHNIYELAGPAVMSLRDLFELAGRCVGAQRPILALPPSLGRLQATIMEYMPGPALMSRDNLDSMRVPSVASGRWPGLRELGITPTGIEAVAPLYLKPANRLDRLRRDAAR
jgi:uncharacterized protein YbjT (DUF2867 family)